LSGGTDALLETLANHIDDDDQPHQDKCDCLGDDDPKQTPLYLLLIHLGSPSE